MRFETVLFDFDGTLVDSGEMILASFRHATQTVLRREVTDEELAVTFGMPLREQMRHFDPHRVEELVECYRVHNEPLHEGLRPFDGVLDLLPRLKSEGRRLGIVTAKRHATVDLAFAVLPLDGFFDAIVAAEDTERHKPDPQPVLLALGQLGARPESAVYVGDSPFDVAAAKSAGVFAVAVTWGKIHPLERVLEEAPDAVVETVDELADVL